MMTDRSTRWYPAASLPSARQPIARFAATPGLSAASPAPPTGFAGVRQSLYEANEPIGCVYFIETGVGSLVNTMANGQAAEVGTIGSEGMVGLPLVFGDNRAPTSVYIQVPGAGLRLRAGVFKRNWRKARRCELRCSAMHTPSSIRSHSPPRATIFITSRSEPAAGC